MLVVALFLRLLGIYRKVSMGKAVFSSLPSHAYCCFAAAVYTSDRHEKIYIWGSLMSGEAASSPDFT